MSPLEHPSMKRAKVVSKQAAPTAVNEQHYVVDDATRPQELYNPIPENVMNAAPEQEPEVESYDAPFIDILESLIFLGKAGRDVELGGLTFRLNTLTHKDNTALMKSIFNIGDSADVFTIRTLTLAYAMDSINGMRLEDIPLNDRIDLSKINSPFDKKMAIINSMQRNIVERLHDEYVELVDETDSSLTEDNLKK